MNLQGILETIAASVVPIIILFIPLYAMARGVKVYEVFVEGAKEGFKTGVMIMPYLVAILVAIGAFRDVNLMALVAATVDPVTSLVYLPAELLPLALIRPLSGGGAMGIMTSIMTEHGPDSYYGLMASVMQGSTETTFYVLAVYFGAVNITKTRHALHAGLAADVVGILATALLCRLAFGDLL